MKECRNLTPTIWHHHLSIADASLRRSSHGQLIVLAASDGRRGWCCSWADSALHLDAVGVAGPRRRRYGVRQAAPAVDRLKLVHLSTEWNHTRLAAPCPGLPGWAGTRKVKPIGILPKQETVSGSGISWDICKSAPRSRQIATPAPHHSVFTGRMLFLPPNQQRQSTEGKAQNENDHYNECFDPSAGSQTGPVVQEKQIPFVTKRPGSQPITWIPDEPQLRRHLDWFGHFCSTH